MIPLTVSHTNPLTTVLELPARGTEARDGGCLCRDRSSRDIPGSPGGVASIVDVDVVLLTREFDRPVHRPIDLLPEQFVTFGVLECCLDCGRNIPRTGEFCDIDADHCHKVPDSRRIHLVLLASRRDRIRASLLPSERQTVPSCLKEQIISCCSI